MNRFIERLLQQAGISISHREFWRYALIFWGILAIISYIQNTLVWLIASSQNMYFSESAQWLVTYLMWLGFTPLILYAAQRFPIRLATTQCRWPRTILIHVLIASALGLLVAAVSYGLVRPLHAYETGTWMKPGTIMLWFFYSYSLSVITYLLVVLGYSIIVSGRQFQALQEQNHAYELKNEQLKTNLADARLQSLKMQLNPHFLFNTHHAIVSLMLENDTRKAIDMVMALSDLLRGVLNRQNDNFLPLRDELNLTRQYLAIQQIRFQDRLRIEYDIDPSTEGAQVPQLLLQPLVENAITHGTAAMTGDTLIRITTRKIGEKIQITVYDNGIGSNARSSRKGSGLGLLNTRSRLSQAYGEAAQFVFDQPPGGSTQVTVTFPCQPTSLTSPTHDNLSLAYH
ncbi:sensor histidine kinase [Salmonirosea aquatica]|uniref:Sensor histidine kinase n=1 Tax=Salmonirosea aquatica TaxID=2654236 RepID=A0A7C9FRG3_9BACT|nr:sensor histidine kinase [Cytophagaceae bacterium SJW1-29]